MLEMLINTQHLKKTLLIELGTLTYAHYTKILEQYKEKRHLNLTNFSILQSNHFNYFFFSYF